MTVLWAQSSPLSVRQVHEALLAERELAYTTVMTVLDRLAKKGTVNRERDGRAWLYTAADTRAVLVSRSMGRVLAQAGGDEEQVLGQFVAGLTDAQRDHLRAALG